MRDPDELTEDDSAQIVGKIADWRSNAQEWIRAPGLLDKKIIEDLLIQYQVLTHLIESAPAGTPRSTVVAMMREAREIGTALADALDRKRREDGAADPEGRAGKDRRKGGRAGGRAAGRPQ